MTSQVLTYLFSSRIYVALYLLISLLITIGWMAYAYVTEDSVSNNLMNSFWVSGFCFIVPAIVASMLLFMNKRMGFWFAIPTLLLQVFSLTSSDLSYSIASTAPILAGVDIAQSNFTFIMSNTYDYLFIMNLDFRNESWHVMNEEESLAIYFNFLPLALISLLYMEWFSKSRLSVGWKSRSEKGEKS